MGAENGTGHLKVLCRRDDRSVGGGIQYECREWTVGVYSRRGACECRMDNRSVGRGDVSAEWTIGVQEWAWECGRDCKSGGGWIRVK